jgi:hypothetical protein
VANVEVAVGVGQGGGNEQAAGSGHGVRWVRQCGAVEAPGNLAF